MTTSHLPRVLAIGLDGYEASVGEMLMDSGELPALARLRERSARFRLDHGSAQRTGLAWEHVSSGRSPEAAGRASAVHFDSRSYEVWQEGTSFQPFTARLGAPAVVFDPPYFDLNLAPSTRGVVSWGAHDPGVEPAARPNSLLSELATRFGPFPAEEWVYGIVWASAERARMMGEGLVRATDLRADSATWLLKERLPDWRLGLVVAGELHSAIEGLWHGIDPAHPLFQLPSAVPAGQGLRAVYRAVDRLVGKLTEAFSDATVVTFAMGGMGPNRSDIPSMVLLPELLYRHSFGQPLLQEPKEWLAAKSGTPMIGETADWSVAVNSQIPTRASDTQTRSRRSAVSRLLRKLKRNVLGQTGGVARSSLDWMPASHYQPYWHQMRFFALPSFYDGRIRINLAERESQGKISPSDYPAVCDEIESVVRACRDYVTGEPIVDFVERCGGTDPRKLGPSDADLIVVWRGAALGVDHPTLGRIGPIPCRRTGGHTGPYGMAYINGQGVSPGDFGVRSSFDVVPTLCRLLGERVPADMTGKSLL